MFSVGKQAANFPDFVGSVFHKFSNLCDGLFDLFAFQTG